MYKFCHIALKSLRIDDLHITKLLTPQLFMDEIDHLYVIIIGFRLNVITWVEKIINVIFNTNELYHA